MAKPKGKQLDQLFGQAKIFNGTLALPAANSVVVTANHSGETSGGSNSIAGIFTSSPHNKAYLRLKATGKVLEDASQRQVFGRLTESGSVWTLSFYVLIAGVETAFDFTGHASQGENFEYTYFESIQIGNMSPTSVVYLFENIDEINASNPLAHQHLLETKTIVAQNTIPDLVQTPKDVNDVKLAVNDLIYMSGTHFTVSGKAVTWTFNSGAGGFDIETTDEVIAVYEY